jgi:hypothetical protein
MPKTKPDPARESGFFCLFNTTREKLRSAASEPADAANFGKLAETSL